MKLVSESFFDGGPVPPHFTCDGEDLSPALAWTDPPRDAKSFVVLVDDLDAGDGPFHHWACYDIPAYHSTLVEGAGRPEGFEDFRHGMNDFDELGYVGPCPPEGDGPHRYRFRLLALNCQELAIRTHPSCEEVEIEARKHVLAEAQITGFYLRKAEP